MGLASFGRRGDWDSGTGAAIHYEHEPSWYGDATKTTKTEEQKMTTQSTNTTQNTAETPAIQRKSPARQAADLLDRVTRLKESEAGVVAAALAKHRSKSAKLVAKAPADVQVLFFKLSGKGDE